MYVRISERPLIKFRVPNAALADFGNPVARIRWSRRSRSTSEAVSILWDQVNAICVVSP